MKASLFSRARALVLRLSGREAEPLRWQIAALRRQLDAKEREIQMWLGERDHERANAELVSGERDAALAEASKWETTAMCEAGRREEAEREREAMRARHDLAVGYLYTLAKAHERGPVAVENALADALTWLADKPAPSGAVEQEGSRAGLAWMPGEHGDETLESEV